jgi:ribonuclease T1
MPQLARAPQWVTTLVVAVILAVTLWSRWQEPPAAPAPAAPPTADAPIRDSADSPIIVPVDSVPTTVEKSSADDVRSELVIPNVTIRDQSGRVAYRGDVDLGLTLDRIERGERHPHRNDGGIFRNLEGRLPKKKTGYYIEYVHATPGLDGPGPQRVILGQNGELFYTADHYQTFQRIR